MRKQNLDTTPLWAASAAFPQFGSLAEDLVTDVVVIGAGVTGLTTAHLLAAAGKRVVLLERDRSAAADTGHTSAHLTMVTDTRLPELEKRLGREQAKGVWDAGIAAIATIAEVVREHRLDAGFEWLDGYLHAPLTGGTGSEGTSLREDAAIARDMGFEASYIDAVPLVNGPGIRFADQARIQPRAYLAGIARAFAASGGRIYEHSPVEAYVDAPRSVTAAGRSVRCEDVVVATHNPIVGLSGFAGATALQTQLALYTSYVIAGHLQKGTVPDALWWDTSAPYDYLRVEPHRDFDMVIFGGEDHKTGQLDDTPGCYQRLEERLATIVPGVAVTHRWSGQVVETPDGLPFIGQAAPHQFVATGFAGNGLTFGTVAGLMISDAILGRSNPWAEVFDPGRRPDARGLWTSISGPAQTPLARAD